MADKEHERGAILLEVGARTTRAMFSHYREDCNPLVELATRLRRPLSAPAATLARALHPRLGADSPAQLLDPYTLQWVAHTLGVISPSPFPEGGSGSSEDEQVFEEAHIVDSRGEVVSWAWMTTLLKEVFAGLGVDPRGRTVVLVGGLEMAAERRHGLAQLLLGAEFGVGAVWAAVHPLLGTWMAVGGCARVNRLYVSVGEVACHTEAMSMIDEAGRDTCYHTIDRAVQVEPNLGGRMLTLRLMRMLGVDDGSCCESKWSADFEAVRAAKERYCYVALDPVQERNVPASSSAAVGDVQIALPGSKRVVTLTREMRYMCPEALFNKELERSCSRSLQEVVFDTLMALDCRGNYQWWWFSRNVILDGGTSLMPGIAQRLERELQALVNRKNPEKVARVTVVERTDEMRSPMLYGTSTLVYLDGLQSDSARGISVVDFAQLKAEAEKRPALGMCCLCRRDIFLGESTAKAAYLLVHLRCCKCAVCEKPLGEDVDVSQAGQGRLFCANHRGDSAGTPSKSPSAAREVCVVCKKGVHKIERANIPVICHRACAVCVVCKLHLRADNCFVVNSTLFCSAHKNKH